MHLIDEAVQLLGLLDGNADGVLALDCPRGTERLPDPSPAPAGASAADGASRTVEIICVREVKAAPEESGFGFGTLLFTALGALLVGGLLVYYGLADRLGAGREARGVPEDERAALAAAAWAGPAGGRTGEREAARGGDRRKLVEGLIDLADRLRDRNPGLWRAANRRLEEVGVTAYLPDGEVFDSSRHNAVGHQETPLPVNHLTVASTERAGYLDRGEVLRVPDVIVYRATGGHRGR